MTRQKLLVELGAAALPVLVPVPQVYGAWAPAVYQFPAVPVPGAFAAAGLVDAVLVSWNAVSRATYAIERAVDVAGAPGTWVEYTRTADTAYAVPVASGTLYWWRVRAVVFGRYSAYTAQIQRAPVDGGSIAQQLSDLAADGKLTAGEKIKAKQEYNALTAKQGDLDAKATLYGITTEKATYDNAITALKTYLKNTVSVLDASFVWTGITGTTAITRATWDSNWNTALVAEQALSNAIAAKAKTLADAAQSTADTARSEVPAGIPVGGTLFADIQINVLPDGTPNDGELRVGTGTDVVFIHPDGAVRTILAASSYCNTQFEGSAANKGWLAYVGTNTARFTPGLPWVVVRKVGDQWQYDDNTAWQNFTPSANDCIVAALQKDAADSGISRLQRLAARVITYANGATVDSLKPAEVGAEKTTGKPIDILVDGDVYGRPLKSRLNAGKPWIDFTEAIHTGKNLDNLADGTTYGRVKVGALTSGNVDLAKAGVVGRTLDNIADSVTWKRVGSGYVDGSGRLYRVYDATLGAYREGSYLGDGAARATSGLATNGDVNRDVPPARVKYTDGTGLDALKPAAAGADKTVDQLAGSGVNLLWDQYAHFLGTALPPIALAGGAATPVLSALSPIDGGSILYTTATATTDETLRPGNAINDYNVPLQPGKYIFSARAYADTAGHKVMLAAKANTGTIKTSPDATIPAANTWTLVSGVVDLSAEASMSAAQLLVYPNRSGAAGRQVRLTAFKIEPLVGNATTPSAWTPGPTGDQVSKGLESTGKMVSGLNEVDRLNDAGVYARIKGTELTGGVHKLGVAGSGYKTADQRNLPNSLTTAFGAVRSTASLSATSAGTVSVNAHTVTRGPVTTTYNANATAVTGLSQGTKYYIYCRDNNAGGSPTWLYTTSAATANAFDDAYVAGAVTIPASGSSGGGEPGDCIAEDAFVLRYVGGFPTPTRAKNCVVGDYFMRSDGRWGLVTRADRALAERVRVMLASGRVLTCSTTAPLERADRTFVAAPDCLGETLLTDTGSDVVVAVDPVGPGWVVHFTVEDSAFWATDFPEAGWIGHHNVKV
jgi:hypothetical protein